MSDFTAMDKPILEEDVRESLHHFQNWKIHLVGLSKKPGASLSIGVLAMECGRVADALEDIRATLTQMRKMGQ